jgi:hypothetical protein
VSRTHRFAGLILIVVGVMIAGLCGTCTWSLIKGSSAPSLSGLAVVMVLGGAPTLVGVGCAIAGIKMLRGGSKGATRRPPVVGPDE